MQKCSMDLGRTFSDIKRLVASVSSMHYLNDEKEADILGRYGLSSNGGGGGKVGGVGHCDIWKKNTVFL